LSYIQECSFAYFLHHLKMNGNKNQSPSRGLSWYLK
jgi:hypothetical protein